MQLLPRDARARGLVHALAEEGVDVGPEGHGTVDDGVGAGPVGADLDQVALKSLMMQQAKDVIVLADGGKLGRAEQDAWAPLPPRWTLVTTPDAPEPQRALLADSGAQVVVAKG